MTLIANNFSRRHVIAFIIIWLVFTAFVFLIARAGIDNGPDHDIAVAKTTAGTILGPLVGGMSRGWQGCCLRASLEILPYSASVLALGVLGLLVPLPRNWFTSSLRMMFWIIGWLAWFGGGIVSFGHALS